jgi:hypothetical protein
MAAERRLLLLATLLIGCGWTPEPEKVSLDRDAAAGAPDAGGGPRTDGGVNAPDATASDATPPPPADAAVEPDAAALHDAGVPDAGAPDASSPADGGAPDPDAGPPPPCDPPAFDPCGTIPCGRCAVTFRLDHDTLARHGYAARCFDPPASLSLERAADRAAMTADRLVTPADAVDVFVFHEPPHDFGRAAILTARAGGDTDPLLFAGTTVWDGRGDVETPVALFDDVGGDACAPAHPESLRFHDLVSADPADRRLFFAAWEAVARTGLVRQMADGGRLSGAVVRYARTVGAFDPTTAEWVVVVLRDSEPQPPP